MRSNRLQAILLTILAAGAGWLGWSGVAMALPLALAFPVLWSMAKTRKVAALVAAAYFLAASRGLPQGVATFYGSDLAPGLLLWGIASSAFIFIHTVLWTAADGFGRALRYLTAGVLMAIPPFGILGWAHPITAAGVLFPGWGWLGLAALATSLATLTTGYRPAAIFALFGFWAWSAACKPPPVPPPGWKGVDLEYGLSLGRDASLLRQYELSAAALSDAMPSGWIAVLPESAIGFWTPTVERIWQRALRSTGQMVVAGASVVVDDGYDNVLVAVSEEGGEIVYRERMPVPGSMWQPWWAWIGESGGARAHFFADPVFEIGGLRVAPLICYEQLIVWPILQSIYHDPELIVAVGNGWWTAGTSIVGIQIASAAAWARLFDKPLVTSFNR